MEYLVLLTTFVVGVWLGMLLMSWAHKPITVTYPVRRAKRNILYHFLFGVRCVALRRNKDQYLVIYPDNTLEYWEADECQFV